MQPDWDAPTADQDDEDDDIHSDGGTPQIQVSIEDIFNTVFAMRSPGGSQSNSHRGSRNTHIYGISRLLSTLGRSGAVRGLALDDPDEDEEDDDDDDGDDYYGPSGAAVGASWKGPKTTEPQEQGVELLNSGDFGRVGSKARTRRNYLNLANLVLNQSRRLRPVSNREDYAAVRVYPSIPYQWPNFLKNLIPNSNGTSVAACEANVYTGQYSSVYDLLANRRTVKIAAHTDDVNSCCWADTTSGNVLVSASDDTFIKVWDRRSLGASTKPSGVLIGHTEGVTYVSAKGDGRYIVSNGKDQALRLWDLRKMRNNQEYEAVRAKHYGRREFDYRAAWENSQGGNSTIARHEWKGLLRMRGALEDWVEKDRLEREDLLRRRSSRLRNQRRIPGAFEDEDFVDEAA
ncbi:hypothetical protein C0992_008356 [Termitomyces sp. T32_za158]|nr:hypothetical protein C0992_008356 [Termitomyces sp. T32_za158]